MSTLILPQMNGSTNGSSPSKPSAVWLQSTVQEFFSAINWDGHALVEPSTSLATTPGKPETLSLETSVSRFFAGFNWDGHAIAAPTQVDQLPKAKPKQDFTLDEFSDLF